MVLRAVRAPEDTGAEVVVPNLSVAVAVLLGIAAILAIVAFIDHNAHTMEVSEVLNRVLTEALAATPEADDGRAEGAGSIADPPGTEGYLVRCERDGWVQHLDVAGMLGAVGDRGTVRLETGVGQFVFAGSPLCTLWPIPPDRRRAEGCVHAAVRVGNSRTVHGDPAYGIRQLVDVALIALSSGVNDATTARDAVLHAAALLTRLVATPPRRAHRDECGRVLLVPHAPTPADLVALTFGEVRRSAAPLPDVSVQLLETMHMVCRALEGRRLDPAVRPAIHEQARLVVAGVEQADLLPADASRVRRVYKRYFADGAEL